MTLKYKATYQVLARAGCIGLPVPIVMILRTLRQCGLREAKEEMERLDGDSGKVRNMGAFTFDVMFDDAALGRMTALCAERQVTDGWTITLTELERIGATTRPLLIQED